MSSPFPPDYEPPGSRPRFQFNLRTLLALTALTAWLLGWSGAAGILAFILLALLALIEAGCTLGANVLGVVVRNLFAYFVCSLAYGAVGFGLMYGSNPTGWYGTDQFLFAPLLAEKVPEYDGSRIHSDPQEMAKYRARQLPNWLQFQTLLCTMVVVIAHRVLAGRGRLAAYVLFWTVMAALVYPLLGSWMASGFIGRDQGWLVKSGIGSEYSEVDKFAVAQIVAAGVALAGVLVLRRRSRLEQRCLSLQAPDCHRWLVCIGLGVPWLLIAIGPAVAIFLFPPSGGPPAYMTRLVWTAMTMAATGVFGALVASLPWQRRLCLPLILGGGFASVLVWSLGVDTFNPAWGAGVGVITGALVVGSSWLLEALGIDDPGGVVAVHGVGIALGLLCPGLIGFLTLVGGVAPVSPEWLEQWVELRRQLPGIAVCLAWSFGAGGAVFCLIKYVPGLRTTHNPTAR